MTLRDHWQPVYEKLAGFISGHPAITMDQSGVSIPAEYRDDFYQLFDSTRRGFVLDNYAALPADIELLSRNYLRVEEEVLDLLHLEGITMPVDLLTFLHNPADGLMRAIYNRLFDLLQGKITLEAFEQLAINELRASAAELLRLGYEMWVALAVVKCLDPDRAYQVSMDAEDRPVATELKDISFGRQTPHLTFRLPEFVVYSRIFKAYVSVKLQLITEIATYSPSYMTPHGKRRRTGDTSFAMDSRVMLLSLIPTLEDIPIVADLEKQAVSKPDLIIECLSESDLKDPSVRDQVGQRYDIFQPAHGAYLVSREVAGESLTDKIREKIHSLPLGFDEARLQSLFSSLAS
jgi:hypothetical protein